MSNNNNTFSSSFPKGDIAVVCIIGMFAGFLLSRVGLSIFMFAFGGAALYGVHPRNWLQHKWWLLGVAWVAFFALAWLWSENKHDWGVRLEVKMPLLLLPLAFGLLPKFTPRQIQNLTVSVALLLVASALYSSSFMLRDPEYYIRGYRQSHMLPTLPKQDHIRASTAMALFIVWSAYVWPMLLSVTARRVVGASMAVLAIYLHVLAAKSGLLSLYLFAVGFALYLAIAKRKLAGVLILCAVPVLVMLAMRFLPTFRAKADYLEYTLYMTRLGDKSGLGDANRVMSYKVASKLIARHPLTGVGTGDMMHEMTAGYKQLYPDVPPEGVLLPHNQFLIVALGCGLPALAVFLLWVVAPLRALRRNRTSFYFVVTWLILLLQLLIEPALEVQHGVFVFLIFLLLVRHGMKTGNAVADSVSEQR